MSLKLKFCLVGYIWPTSLKNYAVLAMIKRSGLRYQIFCFVFYFFYENTVLLLLLLLL